MAYRKSWIGKKEKVNIFIFGIGDAIRHVNANESQSYSQLLSGETHLRESIQQVQLTRASHSGILCMSMPNLSFLLSLIRKTQGALRPSERLYKLSNPM